MNETRSAYIAEGIGTFALCFIGAGAICTHAWIGEPGLLGIALAHGLVISVVVSATMNISGGHINPAVTIAMLVTKRIGGKKALGYIVSQLVGGSVAGLLLCFIFSGLTPEGGSSGMTVAAAANLGTPAFDPGVISPLKAIAVEAVLTFLLLFAIFGTAVDPRAPKIGGFGIGLTVCFDILAGGPLTGAAMNPARTFGTLLGGGSSTSALWAQHWVYWVGPIIGAVICAVIYDRFIMKRS